MNIHGVLTKGGTKKYSYIELGDSPFVTPEMFGAVGDGITDDSSAIQAAVNSGLSVYIPDGVYCIRSPITVTGSDVTIKCDGEIKVNGCDGIILNCYRCHISIAKMSNANSGSYNSTSKLYTYTQTAIKLYANASRAQVCFNDVFLGSARYFENGFYCYCDGSDSDDITNFGILCNNIHFNQIVAMYGIRFAIGALSDTSARNLAYINENNFYDGQIGGNYGIYARKTANQVWEYDGNKFINLDLEDLYQGLDVEFFAYDIIENVRCREAVRGSYFGKFSEDCYYNRISTAFVINPLLWNDLNNTQNDARHNIYTGVVLFQETVNGSLYNRDVTLTTCRVRNNIWIIDDPLIRSVRGFTLNNEDLDLTTGVRGRLAIQESVYGVTATARDLTLSLNSGYGKNGVDTFYVKISDESTKRVNIIIDGVTVFNSSIFPYTGMYRCHYYQYLGWRTELLNITDKLGVYINRIPTSIDTDSSIFNEVGYRNGYRINSSGYTVEESRLMVTGYISAKNGDTIRIKDCYNANDGGYTRYLYAYDSSFNPLSIIKSWNAGVESGVSAISGTEFTINVSNCAYVRLSAPIINSESIITVNQPIETEGILSDLINAVNSLETRVAALES